MLFTPTFFFSLNSKYILASFHHWIFSSLYSCKILCQYTLVYPTSLILTDILVFPLQRVLQKITLFIYLFVLSSLDLRQIPKHEIAGSKGKFVSLAFKIDLEPLIRKTVVRTVVVLAIARHHSKHFTSTNSFNARNKLIN